MDIDSNLALLIGLPLQFIAIFLINLFLLDYKITKQDMVPITLFIFLPSIFLFLTFGLFASFYLLVGLIIFFKGKYDSNFFVLHILVSFIIAVITDHMTSIISMNFFSTILSEYLFFILRGILFCLLLAISAYIYKRITIYLVHKNLLNKWMLYLFSSIVFLTLIFFYVNIAMMPDYHSYKAIQFNLWVFSIYFVLILAIAAAIIFLSIKQYKIQAYEKEQQNFSNYLQCGRCYMLGLVLFWNPAIIWQRRRPGK